jgi:anaerobic ribonucleoside-triphosphate reductase activating protein
MARPPLLVLNKAHYPVTVLGHGRRVGLWLQGCSIRCRNCVSQDTWDAARGVPTRVEEILAWCRSKVREGLDGITISGGEPFDQPAALAALLTALQRWRARAHLPLDFLCYSGYPLKTLEARHAAILGKLDVLIPEPYADALPQGGPWRGSANQPLCLLTPLAKRRYANLPESLPKTMQISQEDGKLWMIGIPARGDMAALETLCAQRGLQLDAISWR